MSIGLHHLLIQLKFGELSNSQSLSVVFPNILFPTDQLESCSCIETQTEK